VPKGKIKFGGKSKMKEMSQNYRRYYLSEFSLYDGTHFITFNIVDFNTVKNEITVAVSNEGRISVCTFDLKSDGNERLLATTNNLLARDARRSEQTGDMPWRGTGLYFEYGVMCEKIAVDDFSTSESRWQACLTMTERGRKSRQYFEQVGEE
jgi:hypothetical protein